MSCAGVIAAEDVSHIWPAGDITRQPSAKARGKQLADAFFSVQTRIPPYFLSICVIVKDEGRYLPEWILYHLLVGVQHIFIYDNDSNEDLRDILRPFVERGLLTVIDWPGPKKAAQGLQVRTVQMLY